MSDSSPSGASRIERLEAMLCDAGFDQVEIEPKDDSDQIIREWDNKRDLGDYLVSGSITGRKPVVNELRA